MKYIVLIILITASNYIYPKVSFKNLNMYFKENKYSDNLKTLKRDQNYSGSKFCCNYTDPNVFIEAYKNRIKVLKNLNEKYREKLGISNEPIDALGLISPLEDSSSKAEW